MTPTSRYMQSLLSVVLAGALVAPSWANDFVHPTSYPQSSTETSTMTHPSLPSDGSTAFPLEEQASSIVELPRSMYFMTPSGEPTQVAAGSYVVETADTWLQLTPVDGERFDKILLQAQHVQLDRPMGSTQVELRTSPEQHPDLHPLVLISSTGLAYEAVGSESGVWPRWGWSSIKKAAKKVGKGIKKGAKSVGRAGKKVGRSIKKGGRYVGRAGKKVGSGIKRGAKYAGRKTIGGAKAVGSGVKKGAKAVAGAAKTVRNQFCPSDPKPKKPFIRTNARKYREANSFNLKLAYRWAPVHYQDTARNPKADYVTNFDYDNDWKATNNWDNLHRAPLRSYVYYSVSETETHWFIMYGFFHPRDYAACVGLDKSNIIGEHENDMEGAVAIVRKDNSQYGKFEGMVTVYHHDFYSYVPKGSRLRTGGESVDGTIEMTMHRGALHPMLAAEANGHGIKAWPQVGMTKMPPRRFPNQKSKFKPNFRGGDGVVYYPSTPGRQKAEIPSGRNDRNVEYALIDFHGKNGIWNHRTDPQTVTKNTGPYSTKFRGNKSGGCGGGRLDAKWCETNSANAPWGWDDVGDPIIGKGDKIAKGILATDPAQLVTHYFSNLGNYSMKYISNPYDEPWDKQSPKRFTTKKLSAGSVKTTKKMTIQPFRAPYKKMMRK